MIRTICLLFMLAATGVAIAGPKFVPYYGKNNDYEGQGGAMESVGGVEFWTDGEPPRRFKLLGYVTDRRHRTGLIGKMRMSGLQKAIAKVAKQHGGDAVILVSAQADTIGFVRSGTAHVNSSGWASGSAYSSSVQKQDTKMAVIKYLPPKPESEPEADQPADVGQ